MNNLNESKDIKSLFGFERCYFCGSKTKEWFEIEFKPQSTLDGNFSRASFLGNKKFKICENCLEKLFTEKVNSNGKILSWKRTVYEKFNGIFL